MRKSRGIIKVEQEKMGGKCFIAWIGDRMNAGATHQEMVDELNALPGDDVPAGTLSRWIGQYLDRHYHIRGQED